MNIITDTYQKLQIKMFETSLSFGTEEEMIANYYARLLKEIKDYYLGVFVTIMSDFITLDTLDSVETGYMTYSENDKEIQFQYSYKGIGELITHLSRKK